MRKFKKRKVQSPFIDNIWGDDLADMQFFCLLIIQKYINSKQKTQNK